MARGYWRCFHCGEAFRSVKGAAEHFGRGEHATAACVLAGYEKRLIGYVRELEADLARWAEDRHPLLLALETKEADHARALQREEEKGYARGLRDANHQECQREHVGPRPDPFISGA